MDISVHIKDLLFKNNCVIIPGFGSFILNIESASVNPLNDTFTPPAKSVIFNSSINRNDGLLCDYIASKMNISYDEALLIINDCVYELNIEVNKGKDIKFPGIGSFKVSDEGVTVFTLNRETNFNLNSFGLTKFNSPAIKREGVSRRIEKKLEVASETIMERRIPAFVKYAAAAVILISLMLWVAYQTDILRNVNYSGLYYSFDKRVYNVDLPKQISAPKEIKPLAVKADSVMKANIAVKEISPKATPKPENQTTNPVTTHYSLHTTHYYIVAGCFSVPQNADKLLQELKDKGYDALIIGKTKTGLVRVAYSGYDNEADALSNLQKIRSSDNPSAWFLHL